MGPSRQQRQVWRRKAAARKAVVPKYFEVTPYTALIVCGKCKRTFQRNLIPNVNEPTFMCPELACKARNWLPVTYKLNF